MRSTIFVLSLLAASVAVTATAQQSVSNPTVLNRIAAMGNMQDSVKRLTRMARGREAFDTGAGADAIASIKAQAAPIPNLYKADIRDPNSEAKPAIWSNFADFSAKADKLKRTARGLGSPSQAQLGQALQSIGAACSACHKSYRK